LMAITDLHRNVAHHPNTAPITLRDGFAAHHQT
jgi:hypothetical protein